MFVSEPGRDRRIRLGGDLVRVIFDTRCQTMLVDTIHNFGSRNRIRGVRSRIHESTFKRKRSSACGRTEFRLFQDKFGSVCLVGLNERLRPLAIQGRMPLLVSKAADQMSSFDLTAC